MDKQEILKAVRNMLECQSFTDWYNSKFDDYIKDGEFSKGVIENDLANLLRLE